MVQNISQFSQTPVQGEVDLSFHGSVISGQVDAAQVNALVPGQPVKLATTGGGVPKVIGLAANTDQSFGFIAYNLKDIAFPANAACEVAMFGTVMHMTTGGAITRGNSVEVVYTASTVITSGGTNPVIGFALDKATGSGQLIRVFIQAPFSNIQPNLTGRMQTAVVTATLAQINAGLTVIAGIAGQAITVSNVIARVVGTFASGTSVELESTNASPVAVITYLETAIAGSTVLVPGAANTTLGVGYGVPLGAGDGLKVVNNGSAQTGGTSIEFTVNFVQQ